MASGSRIAALAFGWAMAAAGAASAATVSSQGGVILVNTGSGFKTVSEASLNVGDQIMVPPGGSAVISYAGNCAVRVGSGRVWMVQPSAPCRPGVSFIDFTTRMSQGGPVPPVPPTGAEGGAGPTGAEGGAGPTGAEGGAGPTGAEGGAGGGAGGGIGGGVGGGIGGGIGGLGGIGMGTLVAGAAVAGAVGLGVAVVQQQQQDKKKQASP